MRHFPLTVLLAVSLAGCGGTSSPSPTPTPTPTPTPVNHNPVLSSLSVSPAFGISQLTAFTASATATDQDGDALTYDWDLGDGTAGNGTSVNHVYPGSGNMNVKVTVKDGKGGSVTDSRAIVVGGMTGSWHLEFADLDLPLQLDLTQTGGTVTGTFTQLKDIPGGTPKGTMGKSDPAEPGKIDATGKFEIRFKVSIYLDFYLRGNIDQTGQKLTGGAFGSGFTGNAFTATKL